MLRQAVGTQRNGQSVSLKLELIQRRCTELLDEPDSLELTLEEPIAEDPQANDLFDRYRS
jgi:hypothetical protein